MPISDHWIPEPAIVLLGCQPWPPRRTGPGCPVCGPGVKPGHDSTACAWCDSLSPRREAQVRSARAGLRSQSRAEAAAQAAQRGLRTQALVLTESERRRLWNGYKGGVLSPTAEVTNRAKVGREWLTEIGQWPDWSLILDSKGRTVGRIEEPELEPA